jgi:hypothetical protein
LSCFDIAILEICVAGISGWQIGGDWHRRRFQNPRRNPRPVLPVGKDRLTQVLDGRLSSPR